MSVIAPENSYETATGNCSVCGEEEIEIYLFTCGHWACEGCCTTVVQEDGKQWSGCDNCPLPERFAMTFGDALEDCKTGKKIQRIGWNGKGMWLAMQVPDANSKMGHPYIYMSDMAGKLFPWNPNNLDMLAEDWQTVA